MISMWGWGGPDSPIPQTITYHQATISQPLHAQSINWEIQFVNQWKVRSPKYKKETFFCEDVKMEIRWNEQMRYVGKITNPGSSWKFPFEMGVISEAAEFPVNIILFVKNTFVYLVLQTNNVCPSTEIWLINISNFCNQVVGNHEYSIAALAISSFSFFDWMCLLQICSNFHHSFPRPTG